MIRIQKTGIFISMILFMAVEGWSLSIDDVLSQLDKVDEVQTALIELKAAEQQYAVISFPGDLDLSFSPGVSAKSEVEGDFSEQINLDASVNVGIPLGLSSERKLTAAASRESLERARLALEQARAEASMQVFLLYQKAWLAQQEEQVLESELRAAEENLRMTRELFNVGQTSLLSMNSAEDELNSAETALIRGVLAKRISWLDLAYAVGLTSVEEEQLQAIDMELSDIPRPPELTSFALEKSPEVLRFNDRASELQRELDSLKGIFLSPSLRLTFSGWDQSASLSYNAETADVGLNYTFPIAEYGTDLDELGRSSNSVETWELGFSVTVPLQSSKSRELQEELLYTQITQNQLELDRLSNILALQIRSRYQQYLLSIEAVEQAQRSMKLAGETLETVLSRRQEQRATLADELMARAQFERSQYRYDSAVAESREAKLFTAQASYWFDNFIQN